ncbi:MAG: protein kinase [Myxococcales bacterium]|nr:protein kinase [Myxococcales bacterium]
MKPVRELAARTGRVWAALDTPPGARPRLVVVEHLPQVDQGANEPDRDASAWVRDTLRDTRALMALDHPNVVRVRQVHLRPREIVVVSDFVDAVRWSKLSRAALAPTLEVCLRILVDALTGLSAAHALRDARREPLKLVHGGLAPDAVLVGIDGISRVVGAFSGRTGGPILGGPACAYLAPEILLGDEDADARADVYSVGIMLWEALTGKVPFPGLSPSEIIAQVRRDAVPRAVLPPSQSWAQPLADAAARAMASDPQRRFSSAGAFAAEVRRIAGAKLAPAARVAAFVRDLHGEQIRALREALERGQAATDEVSGVEPRKSATPTAIAAPPVFAPAGPPPPGAEVPAGDAVDLRLDVDDTASTLPPPARPARRGAPPLPPRSRAKVARPAAAGPPAHAAVPSAHAAVPHAAVPSAHAGVPSAHAAVPDPPPAPLPVVALVSSEPIPLDSISSAPPMAPLVVPVAPRLPKDLIASLNLPRSEPPSARSSSVEDGDARTSSAERPRRPARRSKALLLLGVPMLGAALEVGWWLAGPSSAGGESSRGDPGSLSPESSAAKRDPARPGPAAPARASDLPSAAAPAPEAVASASPVAPADPASPPRPSDGEPVPAATASATAITTATASVAATGGPPDPAPQGVTGASAPPREAPRPRYEPEGI